MSIFKRSYATATAINSITGDGWAKPKGEAEQTSDLPDFGRNGKIAGNIYRGNAGTPAKPPEKEDQILCSVQ